MKYSAASAGIIIDSVLPDGLIADWNQSHPKQIAPGDRIIALDGVTLAGKSMLEELKVCLGQRGLKPCQHLQAVHGWKGMNRGFR